MENSCKPIIGALPIIGNGTTTFRLTDREVKVEVPNALIHDLVRVCNGKDSIKEILDILATDWDRNVLKGFFEELIFRGVLVDVNTWLASYWNLAQTPSVYGAPISDERVIELEYEARIRHQEGNTSVTNSVSPYLLRNVLENRKSTRTFSGGIVDEQAIWDMIWSGYGETKRGKRTVPSAGALYSLVMHLVLLQQVGKYSPGIYRCLMTQSGSVDLEFISQQEFRAVHAFLDPLMVEHSHGFIVISGNFEIPSEKYGNRSVPYVVLEAGHVAQNIHLTAVCHNVATVEIGGFASELLSTILSLHKGYIPLTTIVFGVEGVEESISIDTDWILPIVDGYEVPFSICLARVSPEINSDWSYGRDVKPSMALTKAISEAKEWAACGCVPGNLRLACFKDLPTAVDPCSVISFHPKQYVKKGFQFSLFRVDQQYAWVKGRDEFTGRVAHVLADLVYFPYFPDTPLHAFANSSGVAAHPDRERAVEISALELIERDAFMSVYLSKIDTPSIKIGTLPVDLQERIEKLKKIGFSVTVKDHSLGFAPVAFIFAQHSGLHYTTCASCSSFDPEDAINHALMEVEASVLARLQNGAAKLVLPNEVTMPHDHGAVYEQRPYFRKADFMQEEKSIITYESFGSNAARTMIELQDRFQSKGWKHLTIDLNVSNEYGGNGKLHIIRSIIPGLVPMTFGYGEIPGGVERIYQVAREYGGKVLTYGLLPTFPHPFA
jgi:ribosomal protein S12 methylthiotransferase accessory factor